MNTVLESAPASRRDFLKTTTKTAAGLSVLSGISFPTCMPPAAMRSAPR
jgi:hypothetical protein